MFTEQQLIATFPRLKRYARKLAKSNWEDLFQDTLEKAWRYRSNYSEEGNLACWLCCMMHNIYCDHVKSQQLHSAAIMFLPEHKLPSQEPWIALQQCSKLPHSDIVIGASLNIQAKDTLRNKHVFRFREKHREAFI